MSLYGALFSGVSGLASQSSAMGAISDNISNVNTVGYKGAKVNFQTLVTKQVSLTQYSPGGVQSRPRQSVDAQGLLQATSSSTDVALSGQGMFVVNTVADPAASGSGLYAYTRAGSFKVDKDGYLQNVSGFYLQGWPLAPTNNNVLAKPTEIDIDGNTFMKAYKDSNGSWHYVNQNIINTDEVKPLNLKTIGGTADQTTQIKMGANLPSGDSVYDPSSTSASGYHQTSVLIYDSLGNTHNFNSNWTKTAANTWNVETKTNFYAVAKALTDASSDSTAVATVFGSSSGGSSVVPGIDGNDNVGFFADSGVIAVATGTVAASDLPLGTVFTVSGATTSANNGDYIVSQTVTTGTALADDASGTATFIVGGTTSSVASVASEATNSSIFFGAGSSALPSGLSAGKYFHLDDGTNDGYYQVTGTTTKVAANSAALAAGAVTFDVDGAGAVASTGGAAFFAADNVVAFQNAGDGTLLGVNSKVVVAGAGAGANAGTFAVTSASTASTIAGNLFSDGTVSITKAGVTTSYNTVDFTAASNVVTFNGVDPGFAVGDIVRMADAGGNKGYYRISALGPAPTYTMTPANVVGFGAAVTVAAADTITVDTTPYQDQRGIAPPAGGAVMNLYDQNDQIYSSQGRMDFTASSRADVLAMDGKSFTISVNGVNMVVEFDSDGTVGANADVTIDLSSSAYDTGAEVADLVAKALRNPRNWDSSTNLNLSADLVSLGSTLPLFRANGATLEIVQQLSGPKIDFDLSNLTTGCTQYSTHQWSSAIPSVDQTTHTFTLEAINQTGDAIVFNGDGTPQTINVAKMSVAWANGAQSMTTVPNGTGADQRINWFLGNTSQADGMTQLGGSYQLAYLSQNGAKFGNFSGVSVGSDGVVTALFDNGVRRPVFQVPVATFTNFNGMESLTGNTWIETDVSGTYTLRTAGEAGSGTIQSASLEASTVDIGEEFTTMIVTQRAYSAAAKIITTADQMLDELVQIKR